MNQVHPRNDVAIRVAGVCFRNREVDRVLDGRRTPAALRAAAVYTTIMSITEPSSPPADMAAASSSWGVKLTGWGGASSGNAD